MLLGYFVSRSGNRGAFMTIRYSWLWHGAFLLWFVSFSISAILEFANRAFLPALFYTLFALAGAYVIAMSPKSSQLDETKMTMHMIWGAAYQMDWDEVTAVKTNPAQFAFVGKDKWFSITLLAAQDSKQVAAYVQKEIAQRKFAVSPLKVTESASFRLFKNTRIRA
jgi:hypothetical protein